MRFLHESNYITQKLKDNDAYIQLSSLCIYHFKVHLYTFVLLNTIEIILLAYFLKLKSIKEIK